MGKHADDAVNDCADDEGEEICPDCRDYVSDCSCNDVYNVCGSLYMDCSCDDNAPMPRGTDFHDEEN